MYPILSSIPAILAHQFTKGKVHSDELGSQWSWDWGWRIHPITKVAQWHNGIDLPAPTGTPIYAPWGGEVIKKWVNDVEMNGNAVKISHANDSPDISSTSFVHMDAFGPGIEVGKRVEPGDLIGYVGSTGRSTGPHLHFSIRKKVSATAGGVSRHDVDPLPYLQMASGGFLKKNKISGWMALSVLVGSFYLWYKNR